MEFKNILTIEKMEITKKIQKRILDISYKNKLSHLGSCFSTLPILIEIFNNKKDDDIFVLSSGHSGLALYAVLEHFHSMDAEKLFDRHGVHPKYSEEDKISCSSGSLGQGITVGVGYAIANPNKTIHVLISDGECSEGSVWESLKFIQENKINNIKIYVNMNGYSAISKIDTDYLSKCLITFYPDIQIRKTSVETFSFLQKTELEAHYRIMSDSDYKSAISELL